jgi:putative hemolysin/membrane-bound inhibitor of C-type lysozyme
MKNTNIIILIIAALIAAFFYFSFNKAEVEGVNQENNIPNQNQQTTEATTTTLANPAAEFCIQSGGTLSGEDCAFAGGQTCNAWGLFRGECIVEGVNNLATYTSATSTLSANFRIKAGTVIINSKELNLDYVELKQAVSASGARYLSADNKVEFWEHQGEATVSVDGKQIFVGKIFKGKQ